MAAILDSLIEWLFNRNRYRQPDKKEIADIIDQYLAGEKGNAEGHIIRIKRVNGYNYYITRSVDTSNIYR
ncbi:MAG TPA: hypothetical protein PKA05_07475 [Roseiflexaceae bacterium]|nr:hypothetical protein [Roseiflexaceae bacterium]HMP40203.1 hypothetical protein [Roseiflexaceae bacterium]